MHRLTDQMKKPWVVMPLVALLAFGGWWTFGRDDGVEPDATATATQQEVEVTVGAMAKTVSADGTVAAADTEELSFTSAGTVTAVNVAAGDLVEAGEVLAEIDATELEAAVAEAEASVADAEAKLADDLDADASDEQVAADESSVTSAYDQLEAAQEALDGAQLVATFAGTVATVDVSVGEELSSGGAGGTSQTGSASGSGGSASTLGSGSAGVIPGAADTSSTSSDADITITTTGSFTVELGFDDADISSLAVGQVAEVALSTGSSSASGFPFGGDIPAGFPAGLLQGQGQGQAADDQTDGADSTTTTAPAVATDGVDALVTEVGTIADASSGVASYPVTVAFQDTSGDFNVGASVTVTITYDSVADAVQVPTRAITTTGGTSTVTVKTDDGTEERTVETGLVDGTTTQITSGLTGGETVIIESPALGGFPGGGANGGANGGFTPPEGLQLPGAPTATEGGGS